MAAQMTDLEGINIRVAPIGGGIRSVPIGREPTQGGTHLERKPTEASPPIQPSGF